MLGLIVFALYLLWSLGDPAEQFTKNYGKFNYRIFYTMYRKIIRREVGMAIILAVIVEILFVL
jgi:hypothetical protein